MAVTAPAKDRDLYAKQAEVTTLTATLAAQPANASTPSLAAALLKTQAEFVISLMAAGKLSPATILSTCTYGT